MTSRPEPRHGYSLIATQLEEYDLVATLGGQYC